MANFFFHSYLLFFTHHSFCFWSVDTSCWASSQDVECSTREQRMCKLTCRLKHHPKASLEALGFPSRHCNTVSLDKLTRRHQTVAGHIKGLPSGWQVSQGSECPRLPPLPNPGTGAASSQGQPEQWGFPTMTPLCPMPRAQPPCSSLCNKPAVPISSMTHIHNLNAGGTADSHGSSQQPCSTSNCSPPLLVKWWPEMKRKQRKNLRWNWVNDCTTGSGKRSLGVFHPRLNALPSQITSINVMGYEKFSLCHTTWREDRR